MRYLGRFRVWELAPNALLRTPRFPKPLATVRSKPSWIFGCGPNGQLGPRGVAGTCWAAASQAQTPGPSPQPPAPAPAQKSADPQVRRVERLGKRAGRKLFERKLRKLVLGDWGLGLPWSPKSPRGRALLVVFIRFPAHPPWKASRKWECATWAGSEWRNSPQLHFLEPLASRNRFPQCVHDVPRPFFSCAFPTKVVLSPPQGEATPRYV